MQFRNPAVKKKNAAKSSRRAATRRPYTQPFAYWKNGRRRPREKRRAESRASQQFAIPPQRATSETRRMRPASPWLRGGNAVVTMTTIAGRPPAFPPRKVGKTCVWVCVCVCVCICVCVCVYGQAEKDKARRSSASSGVVYRVIFGQGCKGLFLTIW